MPVLLPAHAGAQETLRLAAVACQCPNLTYKRGLKAPFVAKLGVRLRKKVLCRAWGRVGYSGGSKKKSHVARGGVRGNRKKKEARVREGGPHAWERVGVPHA